MTTLAMRKPHADRGIEGLAAKWYAANTAEMMREYIDLARRISTQLPQGCSVLEVAPGPGYFCIELAKLGSYAITGLDISHAMVRIAAKKAVEAGMKVGFQQGSASNIPFPAGSFDFILCRAAFKNFARPVEALQEMFRVLQAGGLLLLAFHIGDEAAHYDELWGCPICMDFFYFQPAEIRGHLEGAGFAIEEVNEREPYAPEVEHQSRRAYIWARKP